MAVTLMGRDGQDVPAELYWSPCDGRRCWIHIDGRVWPLKRGLPKTWRRFRRLAFVRLLPDRNPDWEAQWAALYETAKAPDVRDLTWGGERVWIDRVEAIPGSKFRVTFRRDVTGDREPTVTVDGRRDTLVEWKRMRDVLGRKLGWWFRILPYDLTEREWLTHLDTALEQSDMHKENDRETT